MNAPVYTIHTDGGSRGNPGPAASGFVIDGPDFGRVEHGEKLGVATNNVAEYTAVLLALRKLKSLIGTEHAKSATVHVKADSELLVKQLNGEYKVRDANLRAIFLDVWNARLDFGSVTFQHVRREQNKDADRMVNAALDGELAPDLGL
ncbi:MAG: ribonuclease HI family protein [Candidatus Yanofskybacteria bacterium]|nr:ribonuclease HI family protein [Candidatus Yanofskybacteria bacterium]